jgi:hypothetical protein
MFSLAQKYILQHHSISLECKTWIIVYTALTDSSIRKELSSINDVDKWILRISSETDDNDTSSIFSFIRGWYAPSCEDYTQQKRKFYLLLQWFIANTIDENHYVKYTKAMGLGLYASDDITIDDLSDRLAGFLEFVDETVFAILSILGHNSLYEFEDLSATKKRHRLCILYGPLSLVNASIEAKNLIGFANTLPDYNEKLMYCEFVYEFKACYRKISSRRRKLWNTTIQVDDFDTTEEKVYKKTIKTEWDSRRLPTWPKTKSKSEKKLIPRVKISWCGGKKDFTNSARTVQKDNQILIPYDWVKRKVFYKLTDYKPEKLFRRQIQHVVENSEEYISNDDIEEKQEDDKQEQPDNADDDYNEDDDDDDDDDDGNDNNSNYFDNDLNNKHFII